MSFNTGFLTLKFILLIFEVCKLFYVIVMLYLVQVCRSAAANIAKTVFYYSAIPYYQSEAKTVKTGLL